MNTQGTCTIPGANRTGVPLPTKPVGRPEDDIVARLERAHARPSSSPFKADAPEFTREQLEAAGFAVKGSPAARAKRTYVTDPAIEGRRNKVATLHAQGLQQRQIADELKVSIGTVANDIARLGLTGKSGSRSHALDTTPIAELIRLYEVEQLTTKQIGERIGASRSAIGKYLKAAGVAMRTPGVVPGRTPKPKPSDNPNYRARRRDLNRAQVIADYLAGATAKQVATTHGCDESTVTRLVKAAGHTTRRPSDYATATNPVHFGRPVMHTIDADTLRDLYETQGLRAQECATRLGCSITTLRRALRRNGIDRRDDRSTNGRKPTTQKENAA